MQGLEQPALALIAQIQNLLKDRYDLASIPKELLQNADDAQAHNLHFGSFPGWPNSPHPLLRGPAILVLNDGRFEPKDRKAIRALGLGSKGGDSPAIGKFGLGMKSIFHVCEAFIYMASANQPAADGTTICEGINPWKGSGIHEDWNSLDARPLLDTIEHWRHGAARWFCLWLPLRTAAQLAREHPIMPNYPQIRDLLSDDLPERLARLFPFLRSVKAITIWECTEYRELAKRAAIELKTQARILFRQLSTGSNNSVSGRVNITNGCGDETRSLLFWVREAMLDDRELTRLQNEVERPARPVYTPEGGVKMVREEVYPHAGACFTLLRATRQGTGQLSVKRAVFLPLSSTLDEREVRGNYDVQLLLHGYYLLDSGRKDIYTNEHWNKLLEKRGALRLILPTLDDLHRASQLTKEEIWNLTLSLSQLRFLNERTDELCREFHWLYRLEPQGGAWGLLPAENPLVCLPSPPPDAQWTPQELFPSLRTLAVKIAITFDRWPRLSRRQATSWNENQLWTELLNVPVEPFLKSGERLRYFNELVTLERKAATEAWRPTAPAIAPLLAVARRLFRALTPELAKTLKEELTQFVAQLPSGAWFSLPSGEAELTISGESDILKDLLELDLKTLLVPSELAPSTNRSCLSVEDASLILSRLAHAAVAQPRKIAAIALEVVSSVSPEQRDELRRAVGKLKLFRVDDLKLGKEIAASWDELAAWRAERTLFAPGGGLLELLQRAVVDDRLYRLRPLSERAADVLFGSGRPEACRAADCVALLLKAARLTAAEERKPLLERLLATNVPAAAKAVRYLLHADREHAEDVDTPLLTGVGHGDVWARLADLALAHRGGGWRLLPELLAQTLSPEQLQQLNVQSVAPESVAELLVETGSLDWLDGASLSVEERRKVLTHIPDRQLWLRLPLHETSDGRFLPVDQHTYLADPDSPIPPEFARVATGIQIPADPTLRAIYQERVRSWTPATCIELALDQPQPERFQRPILDALEKAGARNDTLGKDLLTRLKSSRWLSTRYGPKAPEDVIHLPHMRESIARLLAQPELQGIFVDSSSVSSEVCQHPAHHWVTQSLYATGSQGLERLGLTLSEVTNYRLGLSDTLFQKPEFISSLLEAFVDGGPAGFPAFELLRDAASSYPLQQIEHLIRPLLKEIESSRILALLNYLAERAERASREARAQISCLHSHYLNALTKLADFSVEWLRGLKLLSRKNHWKPACKLALDEAGIDSDYLLDKHQAHILRKQLPSALLTTTAAPKTAAVKRDPLDLERYFKLWEGRVPSQAIGGLVALLGDDSSTKTLAAELLRPRTLAAVRGMIQWEKWPAGQGAVGADEDIEEAMAKQRFRLYLHPSSSGTTEVLNLLGEAFEAPLATDFRTLLVGRPSSDSEGRVRVCTAELREIDPAQFDRQQLSGLLRDTAFEVLQRVYWRTPANFDSIFAQLCDTEQLEIDVAQRLILESAFFYFRQLQDSNLSAVQNWAKRWDEVRYAEAEPGANSEAVMRTRQSLRSELQRNLENNAALQADILEAVRRKIAVYQYSQSSVPFEIFQNADDAAAELAEMLGEQHVPPASRRFVLMHDPPRLTFLHWGRAINRFRGGRFSAADGTNRGFNRDLEKMLVLSSSDKLAKDGSTGKFGLGFKSVFLVCDKPRVVSGNLAVEVVGGMFPRVLEGERVEPIKQLLAENTVDAAGENAEGTAIQLELNTPAHADPKRTLSGQFVELGHLLPVFARKIKECSLLDARGRKETANWRSEPVGGCGDIQIGRLIPFADSSHKASMGLLFDCGDAGAVLLALNERTFFRFGSTTPTFWATAPTRELIGSGIAVNGRFEVDVGRTQLAHTAPVNKALAQRIGKRLGELLERLALAATDWNTLRKDLRLADDATGEEFWRSLWEVVVAASLSHSSAGSPAADLLRLILWSDGCGMARLLADSNALPTGQPGRFSGLSRLPQVKYFTTGALNQHELFEQVSAWPNFGAHVAPGSVVSGKVRDCLDRLLDNPTQWQALRLREVLKWELPASGEIAPQTATHLGAVINRDLLSRLENDQQTKDESQQLRALLNECYFKSQAGTWVLAQDLLAADGQAEERDEALRAGFAPSERVLHRDYLEKALDLFRACRFRLQASGDLLAQWGCDANDEGRREAFLRYLVRGELGFQVSEAVRVRRTGTWLDRVQQTAAFGRFDGQDQNTILGRLGFAYLPPSASERQPATPPTDEIRTFLKTVESWWSDENNRHFLVQRYVRYEYPNGHQPDLSGADRKAWIVLLVRGIGYTLGRTQGSQTRGFIESCDQCGWLDTFAMEPPPGSDRSEWDRRWMEILDEFASEGREHVEYFQWVKLLPIIYRIAISLNEYVEMFRALDRGSAEEVAVYKILNPALDEELEGGPSGPSLTQSLGLGIFFILRELVRMGVIRGERVRSHCFVPTSRMRKAFNRLGCPLNVDAKGAMRLDWSKQIIEFLRDHDVQDPTFAGHFDIPFIALGNSYWLKVNDRVGRDLSKYWSTYWSAAT